MLSGIFCLCAVVQARRAALAAAEWALVSLSTESRRAVSPPVMKLMPL